MARRRGDKPKPPSYERLGHHLAMLFGLPLMVDRTEDALTFNEGVSDAFDLFRDVWYPENWRIYLTPDETFMAVTAEPLSLSGRDLGALAALSYLGFDVRVSGYSPTWPGERVLVAVGKELPGD